MSGRRALRIVLQTLLGVIILGSGVGKALDLHGFVVVLETYRAVPSPLLWPIAIGVTALEIVLGAWLFTGHRLKIMAMASIAMNAGYAIWMTISLLRGLDLKNCGCFGIFFARPLTWQSPVEDLVMIALSVALLALSNPAREQTREVPA